MSAWGATLRIARRDAFRSKGRSALVVAMIALPVLGVGTADVLYRTFELSADQQATRTMGAADAVLSDTGMAKVEQTGHEGYGAGSLSRVGQPPAVSTVLPAASRVLVVHELKAAHAFAAGDASVRVNVNDLAYTDPLTRGIYKPLKGRAPARVGEVVLTDGLAERLSVDIGDEVRQQAVPGVLRVVGLVTDGSQVDAMTALVVPGSLDPALSNARFLVDVSSGLTWADVERANATGFSVQLRDRVPGQPEEEAIGGPDAEVLTAIALVVGMALLEIVLLAGPAFAVGAKRQSRELALLAATGGERRDVRRTVLGSGLVLGAVGGVLGVLGGIALAALALPHLSQYGGDVPGPFDVRWELLGLAAVGIVTALLAALIPARSASRQDVVAALTGRRGQLRSLKRTPILGLLAALAGAALALHGAKTRNINVILAGSALAELGLVATTPFLVGLVGRLGPWLPLAPRIAMRDAARNRGRTAPAVSAVLAAVAGSVAIGTYVASIDRYDEQAYRGQAPAGATLLYLSEQDRLAPQVADVLRSTVPSADVQIVRALAGFETGKGFQASFAEVPKNLCSFGRVGDAPPSRADLEAAARDPLCNGRGTAQAFSGSLLVGGPAELNAVSGLAGQPYTSVLAGGGAVVPLINLSADGTATITVSKISPDGTGRPVRSVKVAATAAPRDQPQATMLSAAAAKKVGMPVQVLGVIAARAQPPTSLEEDRTNKALQAVGYDFDVYIERGYKSDYALGLLALVIGSAVIVLGASGIATGLAAADGRSDLSTLAAVGASPGMRRRLAAFQSAVTAGLGTLLGLAAGLVPAIGMIRALNAAALEGPFPRFDPYPIVLPWTNLLITVLVVPLLAAGAAALLTRSRLPMVRRLA